MPFKFAVIADPHISDAKRDPESSETKMYRESIALLRAAVGEINSVKGLNFTLVLGDLTRGAEPWNVDNFMTIMDTLQTPYYVILGNHDVNPRVIGAATAHTGDSRAYMIKKFQDHGFKGPTPHWSFDPLANVHLVGLDTTIKGDWGGELSLHGVDFLSKDLDRNRNKLTLVMLHHQLQPDSIKASSGTLDYHKFVAYNNRQIQLLLQSHKQVVMALSGHRHISTRYTKEEGVAYFTMPSTAVWPMRYTIFDVSPERISYTTHDVPCSPEVWAEARSRVLGKQIKKKPELIDPDDVVLADKKLERLILSDQSRAGVISLRSDQE